MVADKNEYPYLFLLAAIDHQGGLTALARRKCRHVRKKANMGTYKARSLVEGNKRRPPCSEIPELGVLGDLSECNERAVILNLNTRSGAAVAQLAFIRCFLGALCGFV